MRPAPPIGARLLDVVCLFSGAAALAWQLIWSKLFAIGLGHEFVAALGVVSAFMGGMALGGLAAEHWMRRPARFYVGCEAVIALWGILSPWLIPSAGRILSHWVGVEASPVRFATAAFAGPFLAVLPATVAIGATFPALAAWRAGPSSVPRVYAANTFGAVLGTLGTVYWLLPAAGLAWSSGAVALINGACAAVAWRFRGTVLEVPAAEAKHPGAMGEAVRLFATGFLAIAFEILAIRLLAQVFENTVYAFAAVLAAYLAATAAGTWLARGLPVRTLFAGAALGISLFALGAPVLPAVYAAFSAWFGRGLAEFALALAALGLPCAALGAVFTVLVSMWKQRGRVGLAVACNTFGAALAPAAVGLWVLPWLQMKWSLAALCAVYACLARPRRLRDFALLAPALASFLLLPPQVRVLDRPPDGTVAAARDGPLAAVAVLEDAAGERVLRVNNRLQMGGTAAAAAQYRQAALPLLLKPGARRALFLGTGTGITTGAAAQWPALEIDAVEIDPAVLEFTEAFHPANLDVRRRPNVRWHVADARRFVRETSGAYDVIVADVFHPAQDGAGTLYTVEHFAALRARLAPGGLACQWIPLHQVDERVLATMIRSYLEVFPEAEAWLLHFNVDIPVLGLIAGASPITPEDSLAGPEALLRQLSLQEGLRLLGHRVAGAAQLARFSAGAPLNTDLFQVVTFSAPRFVPGHRPWHTLFALLERTAGETIAPVALAAYIRARDVYLRALADLAEERTEPALEGFVRSAALSPDFTGGYAQVLTFASMTAAADPPRARAWLEKLISAQPARPAARELLDRLNSAPLP